MKMSFFILVHLYYAKNQTFFSSSSSFKNKTDNDVYTAIPWHKVEDIFWSPHWRNFSGSCLICDLICLIQLPLKFYFYLSSLSISVKVFPDNFMRREVQAFVVNCTFEDEGCNWRGEVRHLEVQCLWMIIITITISSNEIGTQATLFFSIYSAEL